MWSSCNNAPLSIYRDVTVIETESALTCFSYSCIVTAASPSDLFSSFDSFFFIKPNLQELFCVFHISHIQVVFEFSLSRLALFSNGTNHNFSKWNFSARESLFTWFFHNKIFIKDKFKSLPRKELHLKLLTSSSHKLYIKKNFFKTSW